jgi:hypothetical protein
MGAAPAILLGQAVRRPTLDELTAEYVPLVLREVGGDKAKAAEILGDRQALALPLGKPARGE